MIKSCSWFRVLSVLIIAFLLFPFFAGADETLQTESDGENASLRNTSQTRVMAVATGGVLQDLECSSGEELLELLQNGSGQDIYLTDDVVMQIDGGHVSAEPADLTTVHTGDYGITIQGNSYLYTQNIIFEGSGTDTPVLTVNDDALHGQGRTTVCATGDNAVACSGEALNDITIIADGENSVAVLAIPKDNASSYFPYLGNCIIYARGGGGIGVRSEGTQITTRRVSIQAGFIAVDAQTVQAVKLNDSVLDAKEVALWAGGNVTAIGSNLNAGAIAVKAAGDLTAFCCDLIGGFTAIETDGKIVLDCTYIEPKRADIETVLRDVTWAGTNINGVYLKLGDALTASGYTTFTLTNEELPTSKRTQSIWVERDSSGLDVNTPGVYTVYYTPVGFKMLENLLGVGRTAVKVTVMERDKLYLVSTVYNTRLKKTSISFNSWPLGDEEDIILSYSEDDGDSWQQIARSDSAAGITFSGSQIYLDFPEDEKLYLFQAEVIGGSMAGKTNIIPHWYSPNGRPPPREGDWDLGDRDDQGPLPDAPVVPLDPPPVQHDQQSEQTVRATAQLDNPSTISNRTADMADAPQTQANLSPQLPEITSEKDVAQNVLMDVFPSHEEQQPVNQADSSAALASETAAIFDNVSQYMQPAAASVTTTGGAYLWVAASAATAAAAFLSRLIKKNLRYPLFLAGVFLCGITIFHLCYRYDNKYMYPRHPSGEGVTVFQTGAYNDNPFLYLVDGWEYYDGVFLNSEELKNATPDAYVYIGRYGGFDLGDSKANPHGRATYRMTILTDSVERDYALELTKIHSRWQLFINGELYQSVSMPVNGDVIPQNGGSMVNFRASGPIELVYHVEDYDGYYSGMVHPPAFGSPETVGKMLSLRLLLHGAVCAVAALIGFFCLFAAFGLRFARPYKGLFCLCGCFLVYTAYPAYQAVGLNGDFLTTAGQFCYYSMFLCVLWIQGQLCDVPRKLRIISCAAAAVVCLNVLLVPWISVSTATPLYAYSYVLTAYKWLTAVYLLVGSTWAVRRGNTHALPLMAGFCVYASALVVDRIYPLHEPILFGWHLETAGFIIILIVTGLLMRDTLRLYREHLLLQEKGRLAEYQLTVQRRHGAEQAEYVKTTRGELHEYRNRLAVIRHYLDVGEQGRLREYLDKLLQAQSESPPAAYTEHQLVNAVLHTQLSRAEEAGIYTELDLAGISETLAIDDGDFVSLLMNLMDNAIEACLRVPDKDSRWIILNMCRKSNENCEDVLEIACSNTSLFEQFGQKGLSTVKSDKMAHGHGLDIMRRIAATYGGGLDVEQNEETFTVTVKMYPTLPSDDTITV